ncbi:MAG: type II toxin-antitoxin system VapC family toxin [Mycobacteriales bacterium]
MSFLLDTNVVSELRKREPDGAVTSWLASAPAADLYLSVLVVGEIRNGIERLARRDREQASAHEKWLADLLDLYRDRVAPVTAEVADTWGRLNVPDPLPVVDGLLAATALVHDWTLVTRNTADVRRTGVRLLDPFAVAPR